MAEDITYVVDEIGIAGMIYATDPTGFQSALYPWEVQLKQDIEAK